MKDFIFVIRNWKKLLELARDVAHGPTAGSNLAEYEKFIRREAMKVFNGHPSQYFLYLHHIEEL